jgi:hypothetical protein
MDLELPYLFDRLRWRAVKLQAQQPIKIVQMLQLIRIRQIAIDKLA